MVIMSSENFKSIPIQVVCCFISCNNLSREWIHPPEDEEMIRSMGSSLLYVIFAAPQLFPKSFCMLI